MRQKRFVCFATLLLMVVGFSVVSPKAEAEILTNNGVRYETIAIDSSTLNGNTVWGATESNSGGVGSGPYLDQGAGFYAAVSGRNNNKGGLPLDGRLNMSSGVPYQLANGSTSKEYDGNDSIHLYGSKLSQKMTLKTVGVYEKVYVLGTAGGTGSGHYANFEVTLSYSDGTSETTSYKLYDWFDTTSVTNVEQYRSVLRYDKQYGFHGNLSSGPILHSATINCNKSKLLTDITFQLKGKDGGSSTSGIYCGIYAVTGLIPGDAPNTTILTTSGETTNSFDMQWNSVENASSYRVDVAKNSNFQTILSDYNNKTVAETSLTVTGLDMDTTYYCRVRAVNSSGAQSESSNVCTPTTTFDWGELSIEVTDPEQMRRENGICYLKDVTITNTTGQNITTIAINVDQGSLTIPTGSGYQLLSDNLSAHKTYTVLFSTGQTVEQVKTFLTNTVQFTPATEQNINITLGTGQNNLPSGAKITETNISNPVVGDSNKHYYVYVSSQNISWTDAYNQAKSYYLNGMRGYLSTITSQAEDKILDNITTVGAWSAGARYAIADFDSITSANSTSYGLEFKWQCGPLDKLP